MAVMKIFKTVGGQMFQKLRQASVLHKVSGDIVQVLREDESTMSRCEVSVCETSALQVKRPQTMARAAVRYKTHSGSLVHSCECGFSERKQFRVDDGEHGLTAAVTMSQRPPDHIQQTLGQQERRQEPHILTGPVVGRM